MAVGSNDQRLHDKQDVPTPGVLPVALGPMPDQNGVAVTRVDGRCDAGGAGYVVPGQR